MVPMMQTQGQGCPSDLPCVLTKVLPMAPQAPAQILDPTPMLIL